MTALIVSMLCLAFGIAGISYYAWRDDAFGVMFFCGMTLGIAIFFGAALISR
jgi:hypothetical protein